MISNLRYEWRRITSIRSTPILIGCSLLITIGMALLLRLLISSGTEAANANNPDAQNLLHASLSTGVGFAAANFISVVILSTIAAQSFGQEYRHGTIRLTLTAFPRRTNVFISKALMVILWSAIAYVIAIILAIIVLVPGGILTGESNAGSFLWDMLRGLLYLLGYVMIAFAVTLITRILALGIVIPLIFTFVVEGILVQLLSTYASWLPKVLPMSNGSNFAAGEDTLQSGLVFLAWVVGLLAIAYGTFVKRDA